MARAAVTSTGYGISFSVGTNAEKGTSMDRQFLAPKSVPSNVVFDLDGVLFLGNEAIPGVGDMLTGLSQGGIGVYFATNNATRTRSYLAGRIDDQLGFAATETSIFTSAWSAAGMLAPQDSPSLVVGEDGLTTTLIEAGHAVTEEASQAGSVIVGLDRSFDYRRLALANGAIRRGCRYIATNTDVTYPTPQGPVPGAGSIVAAVSAASGSRPEVAGKPHQPMIDLISETLGAGETWVVGDRPETDLALAKRAGWKAVLALSGITEDASSVPSEFAPDIVVGTAAELSLLVGQ